MKKTLIILGCLMFAVFSVQAVEPENKSDKQIEELSKKAFRYSDNKGKQSLKLITGYSGNIENQEWYNDSCFKLCKNNSVTKIISAVLIPGSSLIMAFLSCPACGDSMVGNQDLLITLFNKNNTNVPLCFQHVDLMGKEKDHFYYPNMVPVEVRKSTDQGYYAFAKLFGGDGTDSWSSLTFLFIDNHCKTTILSRLYEDFSLYEQEGERCRGKNLYCHFLDDHTVDVVTEDPCTGPTENDVVKSHKKYDLKLLLENPKTRIFQP